MYCLLRYHQREVLLRASQDNNTKWAAFMSFLNEMYGLVRTSRGFQSLCNEKVNAKVD